MLDVHFRKVSDALMDMLIAYPRLRMSDPVRKKTIAVMWRHLRKQELQPVLDAIEEAPDKHPKSVPSTGELLALVRAKTAGGSSKEARRAEFEAREKREAEEARELIPRHPEDQARYIKQADSEHEQIARLWEIEDCNRGAHPYTETPTGIGLQRSRVIQTILTPMEERARALKGEPNA